LSDDNFTTLLDDANNETRSDIKLPAGDLGNLTLFIHFEARGVETKINIWFFSNHHLYNRRRNQKKI